MCFMQVGPIYLQNLQVNFVHQGHQVKVKGSVCPVPALNFECLVLKVHLQNIQVEFKRQDHRIKVKVKVTGAESVSVYRLRGWSSFG